MILSVVFLMLDAIEETFYRDYSTDISTGEKVVNILLSPIWPIWSLLLTSWTTFSTKIGLSDVEKDKDKLKRLSQVSNRAHLIEVCTESSIQPLIQLFGIYKGLVDIDLTTSKTNVELRGFLNATLAGDWSELGEHFENSNSTLELWSFLTSVASVAWSFQSNFARKKYGHMSIFSRFVYFIYVTLAVNARIVVIISFLLAIGGDFEQIYAIIGGHMAICILVDLWLNIEKYNGDKKHWFWKARDCLLKSFSTIYLYHPIDDNENEDIRDVHVVLFSLLANQLSFFWSVHSLDFLSNL